MELTEVMTQKKERIFRGTCDLNRFKMYWKKEQQT